MTEVPPVRRERRVPASPEVAFAVFTDRIGSWWPLTELGVFNDGSVAIVDGRIVETAADRRETTWGTITAWEPPSRLAFSWHPGKAADRASRVEVTFVAAGAETLVTLVHDGWEVFAEPHEARDEYDHGWIGVLDRYGDTVSRSCGT